MEAKVTSPYSNGVNDFDILTLRDVLPFWKRLTFDTAVEKYQKSKSKENQRVSPPGEVSYVDQIIVSQCISRLLKFAKRQ